MFDFDGTITTPGHLDFAAIRAAIGCPAGISILDHIESLDPAQRESAHRTLDEFEMEAAGRVGPAPGLPEIIEFLKAHDVPAGVLTRNTHRAVLRSLEQIDCCDLNDFACVITRDDNVRVKPEPDGVIEIARRIGVSPTTLLVVGDFIYDVEAGARAGARTVFLDVIPNRTFPAPEADFVISDLRSLMLVLQNGIG